MVGSRLSRKIMDSGIKYFRTYQIINQQTTPRRITVKMKIAESGGSLRLSDSVNTDSLSNYFMKINLLVNIFVFPNLYINFQQ